MTELSRRLFLEKLSMGAGIAAFSIPSLFNSALAAPRVVEGRKLNVALCGLGNYAGMLADGLTVSSYCRLAGIVTGHPSKAEQWKRDYNIPQKNIYNYQNFDEIIHNRDIDLVYVVLPNALHKEFVLRSAKAGKHVITEKPMATSVKDCEEMINACGNAGVQLAVGYRLHYEPTHLEIKRLGHQKLFGQVRMMEASLGYKTYDTTATTGSADFNISNPSEWRLKKTMAGGGPLIDLGIYCIQCCRYVSGQEPIAVTAQFGTINNKIRFSEVEETITWQMEFPGNVISNCTSSYGFNIDRFFASADDGSFELSPGLSHGPFQGKTSKGELRFPVINQQASQLGKSEVILENKPLPDHINGNEGMRDIKIVEAVYQAANSGRKVLL